jgi:hypothetical protein
MLIAVIIFSLNSPVFVSAFSLIDEETNNYMFKSACLPGWGQMEKGDNEKGAILGITFAASIALMAGSIRNYNSLKAAYANDSQNGQITFKPQEDAFNSALLWGSIGIVTYIISLLDAGASEGPKPESFNYMGDGVMYTKAW